MPFAIIVSIGGLANLCGHLEFKLDLGVVSFFITKGACLTQTGFSPDVLRDSRYKFGDATQSFSASLEGLA